MKHLKLQQLRVHFTAPKILVVSMAVLVLIISVPSGFSSFISSATMRAEGIKAGDWNPPTVPAHIGWTTSSSPAGNFTTGAGLANYTTCNGYWNSSTAVNVWAPSSDDLSGVNHYVRNLYRANDLNSPFTLISTTNPSSNYEAETQLLSQQGVYEVEVAAQDNVGNLSQFSPRCRLVVDTTAPSSVTSVTTTTPTNNSAFTLSVKATDNLSMVEKIDLYYRFKAYNGTFTHWTKVASHTVTPALSVTDNFTFDASTHGGDGSYEFYAEATDKAGNVESAHSQADTSVELDTTAQQPAVVSPSNGSIKNGNSFTATWSTVSDPHGPVKYDFQRSSDKTFATVDVNSTGLTSPQAAQTNLSDGTYYWRVRACDALSNCSNYTSPVAVVLDNVSPTSSVILSNAPTKDINNHVTNGDFENGLTGWTAVGDVSIINGTEHNVAPFGSKMVRIGRDTDAGAQPVEVNVLSQPIPNSGNGVRSVGFWYNFQTYEDTPGFDEPGFMVFVDDKMVHQVWASDVTSTTPGALHGTGWRFLSVDVSKFNNPTLTLAFYGGNKGDLAKQSFVYVDNVTTNEATISKNSSFTLTASDNVGVSSVNYRYTVNGTPVTGSGPSGLSFSLTAQPDNGIIEYWATDLAGNTEAHNNFHVMYDTTAPTTITDLKTSDDGNGDFTLDWTAPSDTNPYGVDQAGEYDIRYSTSAIDPNISDTAWAALPQPTIKNTDGLPGGDLRTPLVAGHHESYVVHVNNGAAQYWFAIKSKDHSLNTSAISNIATTGSVTASTTANQPGDVVINEIMWMGSTTSSSDEWLELRNMTNKDVDLSGWSIENLGNSTSPTVTLPAGLKLKANGYFVIANYPETSPNSSLLHAPDYVTNTIALTNTAVQLTLKDNAAKVIDQTPGLAGSWGAGLSNASNKRSMERSTTPGDGTQASNWHTCNSSSCSDARGQFWKMVGNNYGTPGGANLSFDVTQFPTTVTLTQVDSDHISAKIDGVQSYTTMNYTLQYQHVVDGSPVQEGVTGQKEFALNTSTVSIDPVYLGTCSTGGQACVSHAPVTNVTLTVVLKGQGIPDRTITATFTNQTVQDAATSSFQPGPSPAAN